MREVKIYLHLEVRKPRQFSRLLLDLQAVAAPRLVDRGLDHLPSNLRDFLISCLFSNLPEWPLNIAIPAHALIYAPTYLPIQSSSLRPPPASILKPI